MAETKIEIVVSGDNAAEVLDKVIKAVPEATVVTDTVDPSNVLSAKLDQAVAAAGDLPAKFTDWAQSLSEAGSAGPLMAFVFAALIVAGAYAIELGVFMAVRQVLASGTAGDGSGPARIRAGFRWVVVEAVRLIVFYALVKALLAAFAGSNAPVAELSAVVLQAVLRFRILYTIFEFFAASRDSARRPTGLTDAEATMIIRLAIPVLIINSLINAAQLFADSVLQAGEASILLRIVTFAFLVLIASAFFFAVRRPIARILRLAFAPESDGQSTATFLINHWYILYGLLLLLTGLTEIGGALHASVAGSDSAASYSFQVFILTPFILAGLTIWRKSALKDAPDNRQGLVVGVFALVEGAVMILAAILILLAWKIDPFATDAAGAARILPRLVTVALIVVVGISIWRTVSAFLTAYAPQPEEAAEGEAPDGEGGRSGSRFETIFPIIRITSGILIATLTAMVALSALGVQIAPLLAGAGIFGLAFGFGAQTLVKDVISGMFYLYEDAFRVGEFIESDEGKGAVEKILLRSVRLRHPRGAIFTIPFGTLGPIKNHSRDWVTMKFSFEVAQTEDLERVRKLVKKVGAKLLEDPDVGEQFIEPLKSQGALDMRGANYVVGVKFTCKPGDQFLIRRKAFAAIQKAIFDNDIKIAMPKVVVDTGTGGAGDGIEAAAAAAAQLRAPAAGT